MRCIKNPKFGEYVLLSRWPDRDIQDPWVIGVLQMIAVFHGAKYYRVEGNKRWFPYCHRITPEEAENRMKQAEFLGQLAYKNEDQKPTSGIKILGSGSSNIGGCDGND